MRLIATIFMAGLLVFGSPLHAQSLQDRVMRDLRSEGYSQVTPERTMLGRVRITGVRGKLFREIIINPSTGEILRDVTRTAARGERDESREQAGGGGGGGGGGGSGGGSGGGDNGGGGSDPDDDGEDDDDDGEDDDDDDDDGEAGDD
jgi:uncharacterized membrane protein YgcG